MGNICELYRYNFVTDRRQRSRACWRCIIRSQEQACKLQIYRLEYFSLIHYRAKLTIRSLNFILNTVKIIIEM